MRHAAPPCRPAGARARTAGSLAPGGPSAGTSRAGRPPAGRGYSAGSGRSRTASFGVSCGPPVVWSSSTAVLAGGVDVCGESGDRGELPRLVAQTRGLGLDVVVGVREPPAGDVGGDLSAQCGS